MKAHCICGCNQRVVAKHHCTYEQELRRVVGAHRSMRLGLPRPDRERLTRLVADPRNLVPVAFDCHQAHHSGACRYELGMLPDSVFEFTGEVLGARAHGYLARRYAGADARLDRLLLIEAA